jgi:hypothetical protein
MSGNDQGGGSGGGSRKAGDLPPPGTDFRLFVQSLAHQGAVALGAVENPLTGKQERDPAAARYFIELLGMLEEKTRGNLTPDEEKFLGDVLAQLRLAYVEVQKQRPPGEEGEKAE